MGPRFRTDQFLPPGFELNRTEVISNNLILFIRSTRIDVDCSLSGASSGRVHSHYVLKPADLPVAGNRVELRVSDRRFRCGNSGCNKRFFAERFVEQVLVCYAQRTTRPDRIVHHLGLALGGVHQKALRAV